MLVPRRVAIAPDSNPHLRVVSENVKMGELYCHEWLFFLKAGGHNPKQTTLKLGGMSSMPVTNQMNAFLPFRNGISVQSIHLGTVMIWSSTTPATVILTSILYQFL